MKNSYFGGTWNWLSKTIVCCQIYEILKIVTIFVTKLPTNIGPRVGPNRCMVGMLEDPRKEFSRVGYSDRYQETDRAGKVSPVAAICEQIDYPVR